jgi:hypothetical protein
MAYLSCVFAFTLLTYRWSFIHFLMALSTNWLFPNFNIAAPIKTIAIKRELDVGPQLLKQLQ